MPDPTEPNPSPQPAEAGARAPGRHHRRLRALALAGLGVNLAFAACCAAWGDVGQHVRGFQAAYLAAFAGYAAVVWVLCQPRGPAAMGSWRWWLLACVVLRLALLHVVPSDDTYRYVWEGRVQRQGFNPFAYPPDAPELQHLPDADWSRINHPDYRTIYPPLAQAEFLLVTLIVPSIHAVKIVHVVFDLVTIVLMAMWSARAGGGPHRALIYGLCPLTLVAFAVDGHVDSLMLACLAGAGLLIAGNRVYAGALLLAGAVAAKLVAGVLVCWLVVRNWKAALLCVICVAVAYLPYASAGWGLIDSLVRFLGGTAFFGLGYPLLCKLAGPDGARIAGALLLAATAVWSARRRDGFARHGGLMMALLIVVCPVVHFWYLTWVLAFMSLRLRWSWLVLSAGMVFYFEAEQVRFETGTWAMPGWTWYATYGPFVVAWIIETVRPGLGRTRVAAKT